MTACLPHSERLLVIVGPSGAGKDTVMAAWQQAARHAGHALHIAQRVITRPVRHGTHAAAPTLDAGGPSLSPEGALASLGQPGDGEAHEALSTLQWQAACAAGAFAVHWHAHGLAYGVRMREFTALEHATVLLNGSRAALGAIRACAPHCRVVHLTASANVLAQRLHARGREDAQAIADRLQRAAPAQADVSVSNDGALADTVAALMRWWDTASDVA